MVLDDLHDTDAVELGPDGRESGAGPVGGAADRPAQPRP